MQSWETLVKTALLGTDRQKPPPPSDGKAVDQLIAKLNGTSPEHVVLATAAVLGPYRRAGLTAARSSAVTPEPAPRETRPPLPPAACERLGLMLADQYAELLPELLALADRAGYRLPARYLPAVLDKSADTKSLRPLVLALLGERGQWLARHNPRWQFADTAPAESIDQTWETGSPGARLALFKQLRETDPARALALLEKTWQQETPEDRAAFVAAMSTGLSTADEPFLEAALDGRRKEVRDAAAERLSSLPDSRLVQRMTARADRILTIATTKKSKLLGLGKGKTQLTLDVTPPEQCDKDLARDGVDPKPRTTTRTTMGPKAWWTMQVLGAVPPSHWSANSGAAPEDLIASVGKRRMEGGTPHRLGHRRRAPP